MKTLTIFTPVYNRAHTLQRLYDSLLAQTNMDFVWLVVDDGSSDGSVDMVQSFIDEKKIEIELVCTANLGKYSAHNTGVEKCGTELFVCVDSDDFLKPEAAEFITASHFENKEKDYFAYITRRSYGDGKLNDNGNFYKTATTANFNDLHVLQGYSGDTMIVFVTQKLKPFRFPYFENEKFVTENVLYYQLQNAGKALFLTDSVYVGDYMEDGLTKNASGLIAKNPRSHAYYAKTRAAAFFLPFTQRVRSAAHYYCARKAFKGKKDMEFTELKISAGVKFFALPLSLFLKKRIKALYNI